MIHQKTALVFDGGLLGAMLFLFVAATAMAQTGGATPAPVDKKAEIKRLTQPDDEQLVLETNYGKMVIDFWPNAAPKHVARIKQLVREKFYDGILFHRVIPNFVIQAGDPNTRQSDRSRWGQGVPNAETIPLEANKLLRHEPGVASMARRGTDVNSATTQFFICVADVSALDGQYSIWGKVVEGYPVARDISEAQRDQRDAPVMEVKMTRVYLRPRPAEKGKK